MVDDGLAIVATDGAKTADSEVLNGNVGGGSRKCVLVFQATVEHGVWTTNEDVAVGGDDLPIGIGAERVYSACEPIGGVRGRRERRVVARGNDDRAFWRFRRSGQDSNLPRPTLTHFGSLCLTPFRSRGWVEPTCLVVCRGLR